MSNIKTEHIHKYFWGKMPISEIIKELQAYPENAILVDGRGMDIMYHRHQTKQEKAAEVKRMKEKSIRSLAQEIEWNKQAIEEKQRRLEKLKQELCNANQ